MIIDQAEIKELRSTLRGEVLCRSDAAYENERRVWNGMIDRKPELIIRCRGLCDIVNAVKFARRYPGDVSVRGGGHNVAGNAVCDDGIMVDLSLMKAVFVDPATRIVNVQGGATLGDLDRETQLFGLAVPVGVVSETGVAGLTLCGGTGWLSGKFGLSIDNVISMDMVTAEGEVVRANEKENADLFWGLRGGGGNFGIVGNFTFRSHQIGPIVSRCAAIYAMDDAYAVITRWRELLMAAPDELTSVVMLWQVPATHHFPESLHNKLVVNVVGIHCGPSEAAERDIEPFRKIKKPLLDLSGPVPFVELQRQFDPFYTPRASRLHYWKSLFLNKLEDQAVVAIITRAAEQVPQSTLVVIQYLKGEYGRVPGDATAYGARATPYMLEINSTWTDPAESERNIAWTRQFWSDMQPFSSGAVYLNHPGFGEEGEQLVKAAYHANYGRLATLKRKYDPTNFFHMNQNIKPAGL